MTAMGSHSVAARWTILDVIWCCCHPLIVRLPTPVHPTLRGTPETHSKRGTFPPPLTTCPNSGSPSAGSMAIAMRMCRIGPAAAGSHLRAETPEDKVYSAARIAAAAHWCRERRLCQARLYQLHPAIPAWQDRTAGARTSGGMNRASEWPSWSCSRLLASIVHEAEEERAAAAAVQERSRTPALLRRHLLLCLEASLNE